MCAGAARSFCRGRTGYPPDRYESRYQMGWGQRKDEGSLKGSEVEAEPTATRPNMSIRNAQVVIRRWNANVWTDTADSVRLW